MALQDETLSLIAFKSLFYRSHTDNNKNLGNESEELKFNVHTDNIFASSISPTPASSIADGIAVKVVADLEIDLSSNGHAFFAKWPSTPPSGTDPYTSAAYAYGAGALAGISPGDRLRDSISFSYGAGYEAIPYHTSVSDENRISSGDARNWIFQYQSGVFFQQDLVGDAPLYIEVHAYTGDLLSDIIGDSPEPIIETWEPFEGNIRTSSALTTPLPNVVPHTTNVQDLGTSSLRWNSLYLENSIDTFTGLDFTIGGNLKVYLNATGFRYNNDYSYAYTDRSLVDKEYVTNLVSFSCDKYSETVAFVAGVARTITHGHGSTSIVVELIEVSTGEKIWGAKVNNYTTNTVDITVSISGDVRIIILG